jgi:hypothetical protein
MFCPNCGSTNSTDQKFCRSCGLNLRESADSLLSQIPEAAFAELKRQERRLERFGSIAFTGLGVVLLLGILLVIYSILQKMVFSGENPVGGILLIAFVIFATLSLAYVVFNESLKEKREKLNPRLESKPAVTAGLRMPAQLADGAEFEPAPTVTEDTTELLAEPRPKPRSER